MAAYTSPPPSTKAQQLVTGSPAPSGGQHSWEELIQGRAQLPTNLSSFLEIIFRVTLDGREAQPAADLRLDLDAGRGRFAPDSIGHAMSITSGGRVARPFCSVNDAIAANRAARTHVVGVGQREPAPKAASTSLILWSHTFLRALADRLICAVI
jgi:hypothetical protein